MLPYHARLIRLGLHCINLLNACLDSDLVDVMKLGDDEHQCVAASAEQIKSSLNLVLHSKSFAGAERLKSFLAYIIEEQLAGRGDQIRAKRIASDVYNLSVSESVEKNSLVRVDAGRLRRRLKLYYSDEGRAETLQIYVKSGGYFPTFVNVQNDEPPQVSNKPKVFSARLLVSFGTICFLIFFAAMWYQFSTDMEQVDAVEAAPPSSNLNEIERLAVFEQSPAALQASSLVVEARNLIFPPLNAVRLKAAAELCKLAIKLAPNYYGGYSCSARAIGFLAFLADDGLARNNLITKAGVLAERGVKIDPTRANAQSAHAWIMFVNGDFEAAIETGKRAVLLNTSNKMAWNYYAMMVVFNGDSSKVLSNKGMPSLGGDLEKVYHPFILAGANFHVGAYSEAIRYVEQAAAKTGHASALVTSILAASYFEIGNRKKAKELVTILGHFWPGQQFEHKLLKLYRYPNDANQIISRIYQADPMLKLAVSAPQ